MIKLLVVDDSNIIRSRIERIYATDFDVQIVGKAKNGVEAVQQVEEHNPSVVTMDLTMPEMDGVACIEKLIGDDPKIKVLVVSALSDIATGLLAIEKGARGFLCKPFTDEELVEALNKVVRTAH
ncbi:MAG: response regulator [Arenicella sp.]